MSAECEALLKEVEAWLRLRDSYRSLACRTKNTVVRYEALAKAAGFQAKADAAKDELSKMAVGIKQATAKTEAHTAALEQTTAALREFAEVSSGFGVIDSKALSKSLADVVNGQIDGQKPSRRNRLRRMLRRIVRVG